MPSLSSSSSSSSPSESLSSLPSRRLTVPNTVSRTGRVTRAKASVTVASDSAARSLNSAKDSKETEKRPFLASSRFPSLAPPG